MSDRWKLGNYQFTINPQRYGEQVEFIGDNVITLDGSVISQPTSIQETYSMSSIFFQYRPRITSTFSVGNAHGIEFASSKYYVLNNLNDNITVYNNNFSSVVKTITLTSGIEYVAFTLEPLSETMYVVQNTVPNSTIHKVVGTTKTSATVPISEDIVGIKHLNGSLWVVTSSSKVYELNPSNYSVKRYLLLPFITYSELGYKGMTAIGDYLVVSFNNGEMAGAYHIDSLNGNLCNNFYLPNYEEVSDVTYDGKSFVFLMNNKGEISYTNGNTVLLDLYKLEKEIKSKGFIDMVDDMEVSRRIAVTDYSISRLEGNLQKYQVDITATAVDRGVN